MFVEWSADGPSDRCIIACTDPNAGGDVRKLDFRFYAGKKKIGAPFHGLKAFFTTGQLNALDKVHMPAPLDSSQLTARAKHVDIACCVMQPGTMC